MFDFAHSAREESQRNCNDPNRITDSIRGDDRPSPVISHVRLLIRDLLWGWYGGHRWKSLLRRSDSEWRKTARVEEHLPSSSPLIVFPYRSITRRWAITSLARPCLIIDGSERLTELTSSKNQDLVRSVRTPLGAGDFPIGYISWGIEMTHGSFLRPLKLVMQAICARTWKQRFVPLSIRTRM